MRDKYLKGKLVDPLAIEYGNFPKGIKGSQSTQRAPESNWSNKQVMLPILGNNKKNMLHSIAQLDIESIMQQKPCLNKPNVADFSYPSSRKDSSKHGQA